MAGVVFCDDRYAYKVALSPKTHIRLAEEAEWFETANSIPEVRPFVAKFIRYDQKLGVTTRECVRGKPGGVWGGGGSNEQAAEIFDRVEPYMLAAGWTMPERKPDSIVFGRGGKGKIIDASHGAMRVSDRLLDWIEDTIEGRRPYVLGENVRHLMLFLQDELGEKRQISQARAKKLVERLQALGA